MPEYSTTPLPKCIKPATQAPPPKLYIMKYLIDNDYHDAAAKCATIYTMFPAIRAKVQVEAINYLHNVITLHNLLHDDFRVALAPTEKANEYRVKFYEGFDKVFALHMPNGTIIKLVKAPGHENKARPSPSFLDVHYRLCEIWHAPARAEERLIPIQRWDVMKHDKLAEIQPDGSMNLSHLLHLAFSEVTEWMRE
ncbi:uncharacterized protein N7484_003674 [Penicillium longicatenatum]|uniref:uncharacterized protein n=1 Tax=Penicillium longicatenatum TaxID=1561947 RepID=UPI0025486DC3|nr:uncharacterized protein N7484_003674 [Penicillium longicatenatum]KAJ5649951.1 hypothetical protein N7484_003674 [Penicillium longicatenatum]